MCPGSPGVFLPVPAPPGVFLPVLHRVPVSFYRYCTVNMDTATSKTFAFEADPIGAGRWQLMAPATSLQISAAIADGGDTLSLTINGQNYTYDLVKMTQSNKGTNVVRKLRHVVASEIWYEYEANPIGSDKWGTCAEEVTEALLKSQIKNKPSLMYRSGGQKYACNLRGMTQQNMATKVQRKLRASPTKPRQLFWAFEDKASGSGVWILYSDETSAKLTEALCTPDTPKLVVSLGTKMYEIDLYERVQMNTATKVKRAIRIVSPVGEKGFSSRVESDDDDGVDDDGSDDESSDTDNGDDDDAGCGRGIPMPCHVHPLGRHDGATHRCDVSGPCCSKRGTVWRCSAGCDFDVCHACCEALFGALEVKGDTGFIAYSAANNSNVRAVMASGKTKFSLEMNGNAYRIDLHTMTQVNTSTGVSRSLRFVPSPSSTLTSQKPLGTLPSSKKHGVLQVGEQAWFRGMARVVDKPRVAALPISTALVTIVETAGSSGIAGEPSDDSMYTVRDADGQRHKAMRHQLTHVYEVWEFEDGKPGSGVWKPIESHMACELANNLCAGMDKFTIMVTLPTRGKEGEEVVEYEVDLYQMYQKRVSTGQVRGLRMSAEVAMLEKLLNLAPCQRKAIEHITSKAKVLHESQLEPLFGRCAQMGFTHDKVVAALLYFRNVCQIVIHVKASHLTDASKLMGDTHYRNQFETHTSGGVKDLDVRKRWERDLFNSAYDGCEPVYRPKYGVANMVNDPRGIHKARQYGECFLELSPAARRRCTFSGTDSGGIQADRLATCQYYAHVLMQDYNDAELTALILVANRMPLFLASETISKYKEVQIHGDVRLDTDIIALHVPKNHQDSAKLQEFAKKNRLQYYMFEDKLKSCTLKAL